MRFLSPRVSNMSCDALRHSTIQPSEEATQGSLLKAAVERRWKPRRDRWSVWLWRKFPVEANNNDSSACGGIRCGLQTLQSAEQMSWPGEVAYGCKHYTPNMSGISHHPTKSSVPTQSESRSAVTNRLHCFTFTSQCNQRRLSSGWIPQREQTTIWPLQGPSAGTWRQMFNI